MKRQLPVLPSSPLPPLYAAWMDQLLAGPLPHEEDATCDDCAMLAGEGEEARSEKFFNPQTKCCTYIPTLPNYLVGRILADEDANFAKGRATVEERLRRGACVTPLGIGQPPNFQVLYGQSSSSLFGHSSTFRCPHYMADEGGRCGVWKHRASVCATWYCKHVRGETGMKFWKTLHQLLSTVEKSLSRWCMLELDVGAEALRSLFPFPQNGASKIDPLALDGTADPAEARKLWGNWAGREALFYQRCAHLVNDLKWSDVEEISGAKVRLFVRLLLDAYSKVVSEEMPERLKVGAVHVVSMDQNSCCIITYSDYDPLNIPKRLMEVLTYFDGRPTVEVLKNIADVENIKLNRMLVRKLTDFGILVPA